MNMRWIRVLALLGAVVCHSIFVTARGIKPSYGAGGCARGCFQKGKTCVDHCCLVSRGLCIGGGRGRVAVVSPLPGHRLSVCACPHLVHYNCSF